MCCFLCFLPIPLSWLAYQAFSGGHWVWGTICIVAALISPLLGFIVEALDTAEAAVVGLVDVADKAVKKSTSLSKDAKSWWDGKSDAEKEQIIENAKTTAKILKAVAKAYSRSK